MNWYALLRPLLFRLPPESAHGLTLAAVAIAGAAGPGRGLLRRISGGDVQDPIRLWDLEFPNRVGLAAGYDKDARAWRGLGALGFGHVELGTVTPRPQSGNPRPRVFRLPEDRGLINRLGFPSRGGDAFLSRMPEQRPERPILGVNLGKQKETPLADAVEDYRTLLRSLAPRAGYVAINVSSPNTPELRDLQGPRYLDGLVRELVAERDRLPGRRTPLLVKLAPDLEPEELDAAVDTLLAAGADGLIATNTTVARPASLRSSTAGESGGLSGAPLTEASTRILERIAERVRGRVPLVAVGGIISAADARRKRDAGADLVQLYTGLVYRGPRLVREVARAVAGPP